MPGKKAKTSLRGRDARTGEFITVEKAPSVFPDTSRTPAVNTVRRKIVRNETRVPPTWSRNHQSNRIARLLAKKKGR